MSSIDIFVNGIEVLDNTPSTSSGGSTILLGGITLFSTIDSTDLNNGGTLLSYGGASIGKSFVVGGITSLLSTVTSTNVSTGALVISGGIGVNGLVNGQLCNFQTGTIPNLIVTNLTTSNITLTNNLAVTSLVVNTTTNNIGGLNVSGASNLTTVTSTYISVGSLNATNVITTNLSTGSLNLVNVTSTNATLSNVLATSQTATNSVLTSVTIGNAKINGNITTGSITVVGNTQNIVYIDSQNSQTNPGALIFKNTAGTGDFRIFGDGGDIQWQGGGSRALQMGSYHEIRLTGGRVATSNIAFITGNNGIYNTVIQNSNDSIGLTIQANTTQTADLQRWSNSSNAVLSKVNNVGSLIIGSTTVSANVSTGALIVSGGAGINGNVYSNGVQLIQPLTTKGDIFTYSTSGTKLSVGTNNQVLIADTTQSTGMRWGNLTSLSAKTPITFDVTYVNTSGYSRVCSWIYDPTNNVTVTSAIFAGHLQNSATGDYYQTRVLNLSANTILATSSTLGNVNTAILNTLTLNTTGMVAITSASLLEFQMKLYTTATSCQAVLTSAILN